MPKSKRSKIVPLTRTEKKTRSSKEAVVEEIHKCLEEYGSVYVISFENMRNVKLKDLRARWAHSRFFLGKNKVVKVAFGKTEEEEYKPKLHEIGELLQGNVGLLFTNKPREEVVEWFENFHAADFARSGFVSPKTIVLSAGPLPDFPHSMEPQLRKLGLPTSLQKGVIHLMGEHTVCNAGEPLTPEQARVLRLAGVQMADFHVKLLAVWSLGKVEILDEAGLQSAAGGPGDAEGGDAMEAEDAEGDED